jgi:hypothetical protein
VGLGSGGVIRRVRASRVGGAKFGELRGGFFPLNVHSLASKRAGMGRPCARAGVPAPWLHRSGWLVCVGWVEWGRLGGVGWGRHGVNVCVCGGGLRWIPV